MNVDNACFHYQKLSFFCRMDAREGRLSSGRFSQAFVLRCTLTYCAVQFYIVMNCTWFLLTMFSFYSAALHCHPCAKSNIHFIVNKHKCQKRIISIIPMHQMQIAHERFVHECSRVQQTYMVNHTYSRFPQVITFF